MSITPDSHPTPDALHPGEAGPVRPGCEPGFWSQSPGAPGGVLVLHGFTGSPDSMRPLAQAVADAGFEVSMPRLPGHGTTVADMQATSWAEWSAAAVSAFDGLSKTVGGPDRVVVVGLSMGGTLTVHVAAQRPQLAGIVLINAAVQPADAATIIGVEQAIEGGLELMPAIGGSINNPAAVELAYDAVPMRGLLSLFRAGETLAGSIPLLHCPALVMTAPADPVVNPGASDYFCANTGGPVERVSLDRSLHVATLDFDAPLVEASTVSFVRRVLEG
jgi:carboxylesterase